MVAYKSCLEICAKWNGRVNSGFLTEVGRGDHPQGQKTGSPLCGGGGGGGGQGWGEVCVCVWGGGHGNNKGNCAFASNESWRYG